MASKRISLGLGPQASGKQKDSVGNARMFAMRMSDGQRLEVIEGKAKTVTVEEDGVDHLTLQNLEVQGYLTLGEAGKTSDSKTAAA